MSFLDPNPTTPRRVLLLSAHTDDVELAMGGTLARLIEAGFECRWLTFCDARASLPDGFGADTLLQEQRAALHSFGLPDDAHQMHDIPVRHFPAHRQEILETLVTEKRQFAPDLIFCPSLRDTHQDHLTLAQEAQRAFRQYTLLGYILPWNISDESRTAHVSLNEAHLAAKQAALRCYASQSGKIYFDPDAARITLRANGLSAGCDMAECFELIHLAAPLTTAVSDSSSV